MHFFANGLPVRKYTSPGGRLESQLAVAMAELIDGAPETGDRAIDCEALGIAMNNDHVIVHVAVHARHQR
jgi:hypothetical protein